MKIYNRPSNRALLDHSQVHFISSPDHACEGHYSHFGGEKTETKEMQGLKLAQVVGVRVERAWEGVGAGNPR